MKKKIRERPQKKEKKPPAGNTIPKPEKDDLYVVRHNRGIRVLRVIFWGMLLFFFVRGVMVSLRPDNTAQAVEAINGFKTEFSGYKELDSELLAFAENFTRDYLSYDSSDREGVVYRAALEQYTTPGIAGQAFSSKKDGSAAEVLYVKAYRKEAYSSTQTDVYVLAGVRYRFKAGENAPATPAPGDGTASETVETVLKVPIALKDNRYIVEDLPAFVSDNNKMTNFEAISYDGTEYSKEDRAEVLTSLDNFFKAYYEGEQSVINYYLAPDADKSKFAGMGGKLSYIKLDDKFMLYETGGKLLAIGSVYIQDRAGNEVAQNFNLTLISKDGRYYVETMDTRAKNLNQQGGK